MAVPPISPTFLVVMVVSSFALPLFFVWWIRNTPRYGREPIKVVLRVFGWGAFVSVVIALIFELVLTSAAMEIGPLYAYLASHFAMAPSKVFGFLVAAPFVEEAAKGLGVRSARDSVRSATDGLVYGAAAGFGFSAMENLLYGLSAWVALSEQGLDPSASLLVIAVRSFSSSLLHASASAVVGYGLTTSWLGGRRYGYLPFYFFAVIMHALFNFTANLGTLYPGLLGGLIDYVEFFAAVLFAVTAITLVRRKLVSRRPVPAR
ncbi:MAG TPA: PrsW family glutamic-type intramembrane protease [Thermoplasmata archaeon]|nr:PrsW family glutamic-type intramembrane protease [Thermoplasmata archaeon]